MLLGKLLRIDPRKGGGYSTPGSNPFAGGGGRDEIYALGLRNPYRFSFDRQTGDIWIGDVGQDSWEEIDRASRGALGAPTSAGTSSRATTVRGRRVAPAELPARRSTSTRHERRQLRGHRRLRRPRPEPAGARRAATSTPTSAAASCAPSTPATRAPATTPDRPDARPAELVRRGRPRAHLRDLARQRRRVYRIVAAARRQVQSVRDAPAQREPTQRGRWRWSPRRSRSAPRRAPENGASTAAAPTARDLRGPAAGRRLGDRASSRSTRPPSVAETVARVRANQPAWEAIGFAGRRRWLERLRDWILDNHDRIDDLMQEETGKVRADAALEAFYLLDAINFWGEQRPGLPRRRDRLPAQPAAEGQAGEDRLPAVRGRRDDQPLELPADPLARRRDPGADGRQRGGDQAVRVHPADADGARPRLAARRSARPTCSTSSTAWARPAAR